MNDNPPIDTNMNDNPSLDQDVFLDSLECPNNPDLWPYNWVPRIKDKKNWREKKVYDWGNLYQPKEPLELVIPSPGAMALNTIKHDFINGNPTPPETT